MKKTIIFIIVILTTIIASWHYLQSKSTTTLAELALANIEALARDESSGEFKKGYEASSYFYYIAEYNVFTQIPCCKHNGNQFSGCSAIDICP